MDKIEISGIACHVRLGVPQAERRSRQRIFVDLVLMLDLEPAANTDDLTLTVDYRKLVERVEKTAGEKEYQLLEALAGAICQTVLMESKVFSVRVRARKLPRILRDKIECVTVEMERSSA